MPLAADRGGEDRQERNERDLAHPERGVRAVDELVEVGGGGAEVHRPVGRIVLARREHALLDAIDALADPFHALAGQAVVRRAPSLALVHDARARLHVVLDALSRQLILTVIEDDAPLRDRIARVSVELDPIGHQSRGALRELHVAGGDEQIVRPDLLELIGDDRDVAARCSDRDRPLRHLRRRRRRRGGEQHEPRRGAHHSTAQSRPQVSQKASSDKEVYAISRLFDGARLITRRDAEHVAQ